MNTEIFVFSRAYLSKVYRHNLGGLEGIAARFHTDLPAEGCQPFRDEFYRIYESSGALPSSGLDESDIIRRCRLLRGIPPEQAERLVRVVACIFDKYLYSRPYRAVVSHLVDDYTTDILSRLAERHGLNYLGMAGSYFPGHNQVGLANNARPLPRRSVSDQECEEVLEQIMVPDFRPAYNQPKRYGLGTHSWLTARHYLKIGAFAFLKRARRDPLNYHYMALPFIAERRRLGDYPSAHYFHSDWQRRIAASVKPKLYFPLAYVPEATTDYWLEDTRFIDYEPTVLQILELTSGLFTPVVKEHFHMSGIRAPKFYRRLMAVPGLINVPPGVNSNTLLPMVDGILVGAGSPGVEAILRGKPVFSYCRSSYWFDANRANYLDLSAVERWPEQIRTALALPVTTNDQLEFVRRCLQSTVRQDYFSCQDRSRTHATDVYPFLRVNS